MAPQKVTGAARLTLTTSRPVDTSPTRRLLLSQTFSALLLQRKSRDPSAGTNSDCPEFQNPLWAGQGPCCSAIQLLVLFFFFLLFLPFFFLHLKL